MTGTDPTPGPDAAPAHDSSPDPEPSPSRRPWLSVISLAAPLVGPVLLGVVVGVAWWSLAPTAHVGQAGDGTLIAPSAPELAIAQDGILTLLSVGAGALCGVVAAVRPGRAPLWRSVLVLLGCALGSVLAAALGHQLGPSSVHAQLSAHPDGPVTSPLSAHSGTVRLVWPAFAALVMAVGHILAARREGVLEAAS